MSFITDDEKATLTRAGQALLANPTFDPPPRIKLFMPDTAGTWLVAASDPADADRLWELADVGDSNPTLRWFALSDLQALRGPLDRVLDRDPSFRANSAISAYAEAAKRAGIVLD